MFRIDAPQTATLHKQFLADWLIQSFDGSPQSAKREDATGDVLLSDPSGNTTRGRSTSTLHWRITSPSACNYAFVNHELERVLDFVTPAGLRVSSDYDSQGRLRTVCRGDQPFFSLHYDTGDRVQELAFPDGTAARFAGPKRGD